MFAYIFLGFGGINFSVEGKSKAELKCEDKGDGVIVCSYKPTEPGYYVINLKFADHQVPGIIISSFKIHVRVPTRENYQKCNCSTQLLDQT